MIYSIVAAVGIKYLQVILVKRRAVQGGG